MSLHPDFVTMVKQLRDWHGFELQQMREAEKRADALRWSPDVPTPRDELHEIYRRVADSLLMFPSMAIEYARKIDGSIHSAVASRDAIHAADRGLSRPHTGTLSCAYENMARVLHAVIVLCERLKELKLVVAADPALCETVARFTREDPSTGHRVVGIPAELAPPGPMDIAVCDRLILALAASALLEAAAETAAVPDGTPSLPAIGRAPRE